MKHKCLISILTSILLCAQVSFAFAKSTSSSRGFSSSSKSSFSKSNSKATHSKKKSSYDFSENYTYYDYSDCEVVRKGLMSKKMYRCSE